MERLLTVWKDTPKPHQLIVIGILLALLLFVGGGIGGAVSAWKDSRFQKQADQLKAEGAAYRQKADAAEERAKATEAEKEKYRLAYELAGKDAERAMQKVEDAQKKFETDVDAINAPATDCERYNRIRLELKLAPVSCE
jgi:hypothetical protein